jgi:hypothetical protein
LIRAGHLALGLVLALLILGACPPIQVPLATPIAVEVPAAKRPVEPTTVATAGPSATLWPTRPPRVKLTAEHQRLTSQALSGNLLGDPTENGFYMVLPSDHVASDKRYLVVYGLHGYTDHSRHPRLRRHISEETDRRRQLWHAWRRHQLGRPRRNHLRCRSSRWVISGEDRSW